MMRASKSSPPRKVSPVADVERTAAEIVNGHGAVEILAETVGKRRSSRLVDDADHVEASDGTGILRGLALVVVEIRGNRDDGFGDGMTEVILGDHAHLLQHHRADLGHRVGLVSQLDAHVAVRALDDAVARGHERVLDLRRVPLAPDEALGRIDRVLRVRDRLPLRDVTDQALSRLGDGDDTGRRLVAATIRDHDRRIAFHHSDTRVGRPEVDSDDLLSHVRPSTTCSVPRIEASDFSTFDTSNPILDASIVRCELARTLEFDQGALFHPGL
jgi:hypothetical protein